MVPTIQEDFRRGTNLLLDEGITLIEWGDQVLRSHGYPAVIHVYVFIVPDSQIHNASTLLRSACFRVVEPDLYMKCYGIFGTAGYIHTSVHDTQMLPTRLHLLPESLVHLSIQDAEPVTSRFDQTRTMHRPRLPEHCISLLKCLEDYSQSPNDQRLPERFLPVLLVVGVFKEKEFGKLWVPEEELESESDYQARCVSAVAEVRSWKVAEKDQLYQSKLIKHRLFGSHEIVLTG